MIGLLDSPSIQLHILEWSGAAGHFPFARLADGRTHGGGIRTTLEVPMSHLPARLKTTVTAAISIALAACGTSGDQAKAPPAAAT
mgnify:CR=1 FL=1